MPDVTTVLDAAQRRRVLRRRLFAVLGVAALACGVFGVRAAVWRNPELRDEIHALERLLAEKQARLFRQRGDIAQVVAAIERLAQATGELHEHARQARVQLQLEESLDADPGPVLVAAADAGLPPAARDAAWALEQLRVLDDWATKAADSMALVTALVTERSTLDPTDVPSRWPVTGRVTSPFGMRSSPLGGDLEMHAGVDIRALYGTPVAATADGTVIFAGWDAGYGRLVVVDHGSDVDTFYGHLSALHTQPGERVRRGQPVGAVGASGRATGAHLHYEVRVRNRPVNPRGYLKN
jgi:murein DD-endopeptidase MepM/ murein hydrolase activator NlpD